MPGRRAGGASRARERERLAREAARTALPAETDVCVVGGGASGLVAAAAAGAAGARVVVLERSLECARTVLATGNGRCNYANEDVSPARYNHPDFVAPVLGEHAGERARGLLEGWGLASRSIEGRLYPRSLSAASVREVLLARVRATGATPACGREAVAVGRDGAGLVVDVSERALGREGVRRLAARAVVVASGGALTGARGARDPLAGLGIPRVPCEPVLCALACEAPAEVRALDGRRVRCEVALVRGGTCVARERGEVLFRPYGVSGVVVFDLSRHARAGDELVLDLAPELSQDSLAEVVRRLPDPAHALDGALDPAVAAAARALAAARGDAGPEGLARTAKGLRLRVTGRADEAHAQVTRGGLDTRAFVPETLAARDVGGLFACGEALDVDGACGGFNLAWAWLSGRAAGASAARAALRGQASRTSDRGGCAC